MKPKPENNASFSQDVLPLEPYGRYRLEVSNGIPVLLLLQKEGQ